MALINVSRIKTTTMTIKQMIIYLNDSDAKTCIVNKGKIVKEITPKTGKGICFNNLPHYAEFPKSGARLVLVATFI